mgnify:CR=1 FL=1
MLISIAEYAKIHEVTSDAIKKRCQRGTFKTARKIGRNWVIDKNEPYVDNRVKNGKYRNWRNKNHGQLT